MPPQTTNKSTGFIKPAFSEALERVYPSDSTEKPTLSIERENKILGKIGFGFCDIQYAYLHYLEKSYDRNYIKILKSYLATLDRNLRDGIPISFFGSNGSGKTTAMAAVAREIIKRKFDPELGIDGRVGLSMMFTTCYRMVEDYLLDNFGSSSIYLITTLLMIDDVDRDYTGHRRAAFQHIISERTRFGKPSFITTALTFNEFATQFPHAFSRMKTGIILQTKNTDQRKLRMKTKIEND